VYEDEPEHSTGWIHSATTDTVIVEDKMQVESHDTPLGIRAGTSRLPLKTQYTATIAEAADYAVDDCFFAVGQAVGMRKTVDFDAVVWWRQHFRQKFITAMESFGNRWLTDRDTVTGVAFMLAERAVRCAGEHPSITLDVAQRASADVQRYCEHHGQRALRATGIGPTDADVPRLAGYWCIKHKD
jgi:hypothetical protein